MPPPTFRIELNPDFLDEAFAPIHKRHDRLEAVLNDHDDTLASLIDRMQVVEGPPTHRAENRLHGRLDDQDKTLQAHRCRLAALEATLTVLQAHLKRLSPMPP